MLIDRNGQVWRSSTALVVCTSARGGDGSRAAPGGVRREDGQDVCGERVCVPLQRIQRLLANGRRGGFLLEREQGHGAVRRGGRGRAHRLPHMGVPRRRQRLASGVARRLQ